MKVVVIGATGNIGSRITQELVSRGHEVTAISLHPDKALAHENVFPVKCDLTDPMAMASLLAHHDAVISSVRFSQSPADNVIAAMKEAEVKRLLVVGGAASLESAPGKLVFESLPEAWRGEAGAGIKFLETLKKEPDLDWTFLSPSAMIGPGERTGKFRLGTDQLLTDADGKSHISYEDYAVALVDELEQSKHVRRRFTVGY